MNWSVGEKSLNREKKKRYGPKKVGTDFFTFTRTQPQQHQQYRCKYTRKWGSRTIQQETHALFTTLFSKKTKNGGRASGHTTHMLAYSIPITPAPMTMRSRGTWNRDGNKTTASVVGLNRKQFFDRFVVDTITACSSRRCACMYRRGYFSPSRRTDKAMNGR